MCERDDELTCANGCGTWLGNARLQLDPATLVGISRANPFGASALPFTRCLVCRHSLTDVYKGDRNVLVLGQCLEHGVWLERADRSAFEAHYAEAIQLRASEMARQQAEQVRDQQEQALASLPDVVQELVRRVALLERQVQDLKRQIEDLS